MHEGHEAGKGCLPALEAQGELLVDLLLPPELGIVAREEGVPLHLRREIDEGRDEKAENRREHQRRPLGAAAQEGSAGGTWVAMKGRPRHQDRPSSRPVGSGSTSASGRLPPSPALRHLGDRRFRLRRPLLRQPEPDDPTAEVLHLQPPRLVDGEPPVGEEALRIDEPRPAVRLRPQLQHPAPALGRRPKADHPLTPRPRSVYSAAIAPSTPAGLASLPLLPPAGRELLEVLWSAGGPRSTRQIHDAVATSFPHRAGRAIQTTATLLTALVAQGWVAGEKRGGNRWVYRPAVTRDEGLRQLARRAVEAFCVEPRDGWSLVRAAVGRLDLDEPAGAPSVPLG